MPGAAAADRAAPRRQAARPPAGPPPDSLFRPGVRWASSMRELRRAGPLIRALAERDIRARYKQARLGTAWALLKPAMLMLVLAAMFSRAIRAGTGGAPYPLFLYLGLLPWNFFSGSLTGGGQSLTGNLCVITKVYCPREAFPLAAVVAAGFDTALASLVVVVLLAVAGRSPGAAAWWVPALVLAQLPLNAGAALLAAVLTVRARDLSHALPAVLQLGFFATPVAYGLRAVPARLRVLYCAVDPLAPVIDGYRRCVLFGQAPDIRLLGVAGISSLALMTAGYAVFKRLEPGIADVA